MALPPGITKKLLQATSDKTDLNKQALRFNRSFKEVGKLLGSGSAKAKKDKDKNDIPKRTYPSSRLFPRVQAAADTGIPKGAPIKKAMKLPTKNFSTEFFLEKC